jgi:hypothetical protein
VYVPDEEDKKTAAPLPAPDSSKPPRTRPLARAEVAAANAPDVAGERCCLFRFIHPLHTGAILCLVGALILGIVGMATPNWSSGSLGYDYDSARPTRPLSRAFHSGLYKDCGNSIMQDDTPSTFTGCRVHNYSRTASYAFGGLCVRTGSDLKAFYAPVKGLCAAGIAFVVISLLLVTVALPLSRRCERRARRGWSPNNVTSEPPLLYRLCVAENRLIRFLSGSAIATSLIAAAMWIAAVAVYIHNNDKKFYCNRELCQPQLVSALGAFGCINQYGASIVLVCVAFVLCLFATVFCAIRVAFGEWVADSAIQIVTAAIELEERGQLPADAPKLAPGQLSAASAQYRESDVLRRRAWRKYLAPTGAGAAFSEPSTPSLPPPPAAAKGAASPVGGPASEDHNPLTDDNAAFGHPSATTVYSVQGVQAGDNKNHHPSHLPPAAKPVESGRVGTAAVGGEDSHPSTTAEYGVRDWAMDERCGLYFSESLGYFMDPPSRHLYDPQSENWFDPERGAWYEGKAM